MVSLLIIREWMLIFAYGSSRDFHLRFDKIVPLSFFFFFLALQKYFLKIVI